MYVLPLLDVFQAILMDGLQYTSRYLLNEVEVLTNLLLSHIVVGFNAI